MNVTSGAPPMAAHPVTALSLLAKASLPQGTPPNGNRSRTASTATQSNAVVSGHQGARVSSATPPPNMARNTAHIAESPSQASGPMTRSHGIRPRKNVMPKTAPSAIPKRIESVFHQEREPGHRDHAQGPPAVRRERQDQCRTSQRGQPEPSKSQPRTSHAWLNFGAPNYCGRNSNHDIDGTCRKRALGRSRCDDGPHRSRRDDRLGQYLGR